MNAPLVRIDNLTKTFVAGAPAAILPASQAA